MSAVVHLMSVWTEYIASDTCTRIRRFNVVIHVTYIESVEFVIISYNNVYKNQLIDTCNIM